VIAVYRQKSNISWHEEVKSDEMMMMPAFIVPAH